MERGRIKRCKKRNNHGSGRGERSVRKQSCKGSRRIHERSKKTEKNKRKSGQYNQRYEED